MQETAVYNTAVHNIMYLDYELLLCYQNRVLSNNIMVVGWPEREQVQME